MNYSLSRHFSRLCVLAVCVLGCCVASEVSAQTFLVRDITGKDVVIDTGKKKEKEAEVKSQELKLTFRHGGVLFKDIPFSSVVSMQRVLDEKKAENLWDMELTTGEKLRVRVEAPNSITALATVGTLQDNYEMPLSQIIALVSDKSKVFAELKPDFKAKPAKPAAP